MAHGNFLPCTIELHAKGPNFGHFYKINGKSQNVDTADLGYLGFQDYLSIKIKGSHTPCDVTRSRSIKLLSPWTTLLSRGVRGTCICHGCSSVGGVWTPNEIAHYV